MKKELILLVVLAILAIPFVSKSQVRINEVCSSNSTALADEDGDYRDWIELYNLSLETIDLTGYFLTDNKNDTTKWSFESGAIDSGQYLVVFASNKDRPSGPEFHTSFKVSQDGETLWLYDSDKILLDSVMVPFVSTDLTYGSYPNGGEQSAFFQTPTPSASNDNGNPSDHIVAFKPRFSLNPGIYKQTQQIEISSNDANAELRFTTDGSDPSETSELYTQPIEVAVSTVITAQSLVSGLLPSVVSTANYVLQEEQHIPIVCLSTPPDYFFNPDTGIYVFGPNASPDFPYYGANFWSDTEVPVTVQWFDDYGKLGFEQKMGTRIHGGSVSRTRPMRSLRLLADLIIKFGYVKAQGGQWPAVFVDQGYLTADMLGIDYIRWLYTAITRASEKLYLVNFNEQFLFST